MPPPSSDLEKWITRKEIRADELVPRRRGDEDMVEVARPLPRVGHTQAYRPQPDSPPTYVTVEPDGSLTRDPRFLPPGWEGGWFHTQIPNADGTGAPPPEPTALQRFARDPAVRMSLPGAAPAVDALTRAVRPLGRAIQRTVAPEPAVRIDPQSRPRTVAAPLPSPEEMERDRAAVYRVTIPAIQSGRTSAASAIAQVRERNLLPEPSMLMDFITAAIRAEAERTQP